MWEYYHYLVNNQNNLCEKDSYEFERLLISVGLKERNENKDSKAPVCP
jgi:hypothetical protein